MYVTSFENVAVTASQDFFEITPGDDKIVFIHALFLSQSSDVGDAEEEMLRIKLIRGHATSGSGGGTANEVALDPNDGAAGYTGEINNTTIASAGTPVDIHADAFNIRTGYQMIWTPEMRPVVTQTQTTLVVRLMAAPTDSLTMSGCIYIEEI
jgi:hypothetical protein